MKNKMLGLYTYLSSLPDSKNWFCLELHQSCFNTDGHVTATIVDKYRWSKENRTHNRI